MFEPAEPACVVWVCNMYHAKAGQVVFELVLMVFVVVLNVGKLLSCIYGYVWLLLYVYGNVIVCYEVVY